MKTTIIVPLHIEIEADDFQHIEQAKNQIETEIKAQMKNLHYEYRIDGQVISIRIVNK